MIPKTRLLCSPFPLLRQVFRPVRCCGDGVELISFSSDGVGRSVGFGNYRVCVPCLLASLCPSRIVPLWCVSNCLPLPWWRWQTFGAESWVVTVLRDGCLVPVRSVSPLTLTLVSFPTYQAGTPRDLALRLGFEALLAKGALESPCDSGPGFYSRLFLVGKTTV